MNKLLAHTILGAMALIVSSCGQEPSFDEVSTKDIQTEDHMETIDAQVNTPGGEVTSGPETVVGSTVTDDPLITDHGSNPPETTTVEVDPDAHIPDENIEVIENGTAQRLIGVGYAAGNFDDWNDAAICFTTAESDISIQGHRIVANKDVTLTVMLFAASYPDPTVNVYKIKNTGEEELLISRRLGMNQRVQQDFDFERGEELYTRITSGGNMYEQSSTTYSRVTPNNCDDYNDR